MDPTTTTFIAALEVAERIDALERERHIRREARARQPQPSGRPSRGRRTLARFTKRRRPSPDGAAT